MHVVSSIVCANRLPWTAIFSDFCVIFLLPLVKPWSVCGDVRRGGSSDTLGFLLKWKGFRALKNRNSVIENLEGAPRLSGFFGSRVNFESWYGKYLVGSNVNGKSEFAIDGDWNVGA